MTVQSPKKIGAWMAVSLAILLVAFNTGYAQGLQYTPKESPVKSFASNVGDDVLYVFSAPLRMTVKGGLQLFALTAVTTGFVTLLDNRIDENFLEDDDVYVKPAKGLAKIGDGYDRISSKYVLGGISATMLTAGLVFKDQKLLQTARLMVESFAVAGVITRVAKWTFGRARPYTGEGASDFDLFRFSGSRDYRSFPSGHTTSAFAMMTVVAKQYDYWWVKIPAYTFAVSVAMQRLDSRNHWGADVVVGGAIGYWVGSTLVSRYKKQTSKQSWSAYFLGTRLGVLIHF